MTERVLITGAAGLIGTLLRRTLAGPGRELRLLDLRPQAPLEPGERAELVQASILDDGALRRAFQDVDAVVHLAGLATGGFSWAQYVEVNIDGTQRVFEAARLSDVGRVVYASSHHVMGNQPTNDGVEVGEYVYPRPDSFYAVSKIAGESLGRLYHDRHGLDVLCLRIGSFRERPTDRRALWNWLSPGDCTRLFEAALSAPAPGFCVVWGVSANSARIMSLDEASTIGYFPVDDAALFEADVLATAPAEDLSVVDVIGGPFAAGDFDEPRP